MTLLLRHTHTHHKDVVDCWKWTNFEVRYFTSPFFFSLFILLWKETFFQKHTFCWSFDDSFIADVGFCCYSFSFFAVDGDLLCIIVVFPHCFFFSVQFVWLVICLFIAIAFCFCSLDLLIDMLFDWKFLNFRFHHIDVQLVVNIWIIFRLAETKARNIDILKESQIFIIFNLYFTHNTGIDKDVNLHQHCLKEPKQSHPNGCTIDWALHAVFWRFSCLDESELLGNWQVNRI